jgi:hypothetical protein
VHSVGDVENEGRDIARTLSNLLYPGSASLRRTSVLSICGVDAIDASWTIGKPQHDLF